MGFLDKVKDTANKAAEKVQQGAEVAQDKLEETKQKKKVGDLKEELGGIVYAQRTGMAPVDADIEITRLVAEIGELAAQLEASSEEATSEDSGERASGTGDTSPS